MTTNSEFERAENEGMPVQLEIPGHHYENIRSAKDLFNDDVEQTDASQAEGQAGTNHTEMMEMLGGIFVQVSRLYDVMMMTLPVDMRTDILEAHSRGHLLGDPPSLTEDAWE